MTFGASGTRVTAGIPGSGLVYTEKLGSGRALGTTQSSADGERVSVSSSEDLIRYINSGASIANPETGRKYSAVQLNAMLRRIQKAEKLADATASVDVERRTYESMIDIGRECLSIPLESFWADQLVIREYEVRPFEVPEPNEGKIAEMIRAKVSCDPKGFQNVSGCCQGTHWGLGS